MKTPSATRQEWWQRAGVSKKRGTLVAAALLVAVLGGLAWLVLPKAEPEPVFQGKPLSEWLEAYTNPTSANPGQQTSDAFLAVSHIGTNAIPTLMRLLRARDSALTLKLVALAEKQHLVKIHYVRAGVLNECARNGFHILHVETKGAVPALIRIYEENISPDSRWCTASALAGIGPDAKAAVPLLVGTVMDTNTPDESARRVRWHAIDALGLIHAESQLAVPALTKALDDPDSRVRVLAAGSLGPFGPEAKAALHNLFSLLKDDDMKVRLCAAFAIKTIDPEAGALRKAELDAAIASPGR